MATQRPKKAPIDWERIKKQNTAAIAAREATGAKSVEIVTPYSPAPQATADKPRVVSVDTHGDVWESSYTPTVQTPELNAATGGFQPVEPEVPALPAISDTDYGQQKAELEQQLSNLQRQRMLANAGGGLGVSRYNDDISGLERQIQELDTRQAQSRYADAYGRMTARNRNDTARLGELLTRERELQRGSGVMANENLLELTDISREISSIRQQLREQNFTDDEIDSLARRSQQEYNAAQTLAMQQETYEKAGDRAGFVNLLARVANSTGGALSAVDLLAQNLLAGTDAITGQRELVDYNTAAQRFINRNEAVRQAHNENIAANMEERYGTGTKQAERAAQISIFANNILESMGQTGVSIALSPVLGPAATILQGSSAAAQTAHDYHNMGYSDGQAITMGVAAGAIETITEKFGLEKLFGLKNLGGLSGKALYRQLAGNMARQGITEGLEESASNILNVVADTLILADENSWIRERDALMSQGMSQTEAEKQVAINHLRELGSDFLAGFVSGGTFGAAKSLFSLNRQVDAGLEAAADAGTGGDTAAPAQADQTQNAAPATTESPAAETVRTMMEGGINRSKANRIINDPALKAAFEELTGTKITGTKGEQARAVMEAGRTAVETATEAVPAQEVQTPAETANAAQEPLNAAEQAAQELLGGGQEQRTPVSVGRATTIQNPYTGETPVQNFTRQAPTEINEEQLQQAQTLYQQAEAQSQREGSNLKTVLSRLYSAFQGPKNVLIPGMSFAGREYTVSVSNSLPKKIASQFPSAEAFSILDRLEDVIRTGEYVGSGQATINGEPKKKIIRYDYFESDAIIGGVPCIIKWDVEAVPGNNKYKTHRVVNMQIDPVIAAGRAGSVDQNPTITGSIAWEPAGSAATVPNDSIPNGQTTSQEENGGTPPDMGGGPYHPINPVGAAEAKVLQGRDPIRVPRENFEGHLTSKTASTIINSGLTTTEVANSLAQAITDGKLSRLPYTDSAAKADAQNTVAQLGYDAALQSFRADVENGRGGKKLNALGIELFNMAIAANDPVTAADIAADITEVARESAQAIQVINLFNKASPEGRVYFAVKGLDNVMRNLTRKYGDRAANVEIDPALMSEYYSALRGGDETAIQTAWKDIIRDIAGQIPPNWRDRLNSWRYLSMLGNARTHVRNVTGNAAAIPLRLMKNALGAAMETATGTKNRTKGFVNPASAADRSLLSMAFHDYHDVQTTIENGGRTQDAYSEIDGERSAFGWKPLDAAANLNTWAMAKEDQLFSQTSYASALAGWMKANGVSPMEFGNMITDAQNGKISEQFAGARSYAIKEAQKATYRDSNKFSDWVSKAGNQKGVLGFAADAILPFRRTPANVLVRAVEYSPANLLRGIKNALFDVGRADTDPKKITGSEAIDRIAAGASGTIAMGLGALLYSMGVISASGNDDEKQEGFNNLRGERTYSLNLPNGRSISIDWAAPTALTMFVGAELYRYYMDRNEEGNFQDFLGSLGSIADPILETSMLSGVNDLIESMQYAKDGRFVPSLISSSVTSYLSQFVPTLFGQIERTFDDGPRQETFRYGDSDILNSSGQYAFGNIMNKLPGEYNQIDYVDAWGRTQDNGTLAERAARNLLAPWNTYQDGSTPLDGELQRLYDLNYTNVFPERQSQSYQLSLYNEDGEITGKTRLTEEQYEQYNKTMGQTRYELLTEIFGSDTYKAMSDEQKADLVTSVMQYGKAVADREAAEANGAHSNMDRWMETALNSKNPARYLQTYSTFSNAANERNRDYAALDSVLDLYGRMPASERESLEESFGKSISNLYEAAQGGVSARNWYSVYDAVSALEPEPGETSVPVYRELEEVLHTANSRDLDTLLPQYMNGLAPDRYELARDMGFSADRFVEFYRAANTITGDKNQNGNTISGSRKKNLRAWALENGWSDKWFNYMYTLFNADGKDLDAWDNFNWS